MGDRVKTNPLRAFEYNIIIAYRENTVAVYIDTAD